jgi:hypothetical protein
VNVFPAVSVTVIVFPLGRRFPAEQFVPALQ